MGILYRTQILYTNLTTACERMSSFTSVVLKHATGRKIIPPNLGLDRRGNKGGGFKYALGVTSDYTPITWEM